MNLFLDNYHTKTPAAMSHGFKRYSQYDSTMPKATWHMSTAAAPSLLTPYTDKDTYIAVECMDGYVKHEILPKKKKSSS